MKLSHLLLVGGVYAALLLVAGCGPKAAAQEATQKETPSRVEQIAGTETCTVRQVSMTISLAFVAPKLVQAAVDGRLPRGVGIANLRDAPVAWSLQYARLGLAS